MPDNSDLAFDELVASRRQLQNFCYAHYSSLLQFHEGISFRLYLNDKHIGKKVRYLSSTATCYESLLECPDTFLPDQHKKDGSKKILQLAEQFALSALKDPKQDWKSDGSARIYCRCRTLPLVISHLVDNEVAKYNYKIDTLLKQILLQLEKEVSRLAIGEASGRKIRDWYPPNAFHTYWTLYTLKTIEVIFPGEFDRLHDEFKESRFQIDRLREEMLTWSWKTAGYQISLHSSHASTLDSDQLAWSLTTLLTFDQGFQASLPKQDFIRCGFKCLFEQQNEIGIWRTGAPLFHYQNSGNAHCYVFETFATLLKSVLTRQKEGPFLRQELLPYARNLLKLWNYADSTKIENSGLWGWNSGHRANHKEPESWATASVFSYTQFLRRLLGIWTRETAAKQLNVDISRKSSEEAVKELSQRGDTWTQDLTAANQLVAYFVNPVRIFESDTAFDPDSQPISKDQARAAILFGPPGTSKTTLSRNVARAIGWDYVELHASHFVAAGLPDVQRTADKIFGELMELDRTVILFDEIDELVRAREKDSDPFGRFLTTSMLPKLAELWKKRKVIYFVATNHIKSFDPAIRRAERFDLLIDVSPPSFKIKLARIKELLRNTSRNDDGHELTSNQVETALEHAVKYSDARILKKEEPPFILPPEANLAKYLLVRYDQLDEVASLLRDKVKNPESAHLTADLFTQVFSEFSEPSLKYCEPFSDYFKSRQYQQYDFSKVNVWTASGVVPENFKSELKHRKRNGKDEYWYESRTGPAKFGTLSANCKVVAPGVITISRTKS
jgi:hypothetical protein